MNELWTTAPEVKRIVSLAFPSYTGDKIRVTAITGNMRLDSTWSGGSRDYWCLVDMTTGKHVAIPENGNPFMNGGQVFTLEALPINIALVQRIYFCGKDLGCRVHVSPDNLNRMALPAPKELTLAQKIVLGFTAGRKSSYNGQNRQQMAESETGLKQAEWEQAKAECIAAGWLKNNGAITNEGRNAIGNERCENLRVPGYKQYAWQS